MNKRYLIAGYRICCSLLIFAALAVNFDRTLHDHSGVVNYFSFFTEQSSIYAAIIWLIIASTLLPGSKFKLSAYWRGAAVLYTVITGVVFFLLLRGPDPTAIPWANDWLHYIFPIVILLDWFIFIPDQKLEYKKALLWIIYPLIFLFYSLIRGSIVHWYPYPFLNPVKSGVLYVSEVVIAILAAALLFILLVCYSTSERSIFRFKNAKKLFLKTLVLQK